MLCCKRGNKEDENATLVALSSSERNGAHGRKVGGVKETATSDERHHDEDLSYRLQPYGLHAPRLGRDDDDAVIDGGVDDAMDTWRPSTTSTFRKDEKAPPARASTPPPASAPAPSTSEPAEDERRKSVVVGSVDLGADDSFQSGGGVGGVAPASAADSSTEIVPEEAEGEMKIRLLNDSMSDMSGLRDDVDPDDPRHAVRTVEITKNPGESLGFYIREGDGVERENGVFISRLTPGSLLQKSGLLNVSDEILTVNSINVSKMNLDDVVVIMSIPKRLVLLVRGRRTGLAEAKRDSLHHLRLHMPVVVSGSGGGHGRGSASGTGRTPHVVRYSEPRSAELGRRFPDGRASLTRHSQRPETTGRATAGHATLGHAPASHANSGHATLQDFPCDINAIKMSTLERKGRIERGNSILKDQLRWDPCFEKDDSLRQSIGSVSPSSLSSIGASSCDRPRPSFRSPVPGSAPKVSASHLQHLQQHLQHLQQPLFVGAPADFGTVPQEDSNDSGHVSEVSGGVYDPLGSAGSASAFGWRASSSGADRPLSAREDLTTLLYGTASSSGASSRGTGGVGGLGGLGARSPDPPARRLSHTASMSRVTASSYAARILDGDDDDLLASTLLSTRSPFLAHPVSPSLARPHPPNHQSHPQSKYVNIHVNRLFGGAEGSDNATTPAITFSSLGSALKRHGSETQVNSSSDGVSVVEPRFLSQQRRPSPQRRVRVGAEPSFEGLRGANPAASSSASVAATIHSQHPTISSYNHGRSRSSPPRDPLLGEGRGKE